MAPDLEALPEAEMVLVQVAMVLAVLRGESGRVPGWETVARKLGLLAGTVTTVGFWQRSALGKKDRIELEQKLEA